MAMTWLDASLGRRVAAFASVFAALEAGLAVVAVLALLAEDPMASFREGLGVPLLLAAMVLVGGVVAMNVALVVNRMVAQPLRTLADSVDAAGRGDHLIRVEGARSDELGRRDEGSTSCWRASPTCR